MNRQQRPNNLNSTRRFSVRLALATGATMATLLGSQTLALLEKPASQKAIQTILASNTPGAVASEPTQPTLINPPTVTGLPTQVLPPAAPILVIRNPGAVPTVIATQGATQPPQSNVGGIVPPKPVAIQAPPPPQAPVAVAGQPGGQPAAPPSAAVVQPAPAQPAPVSRPSAR